MENVKKVPPTIMPPHESPNITLEQARAAWAKVKAEDEARRKKRRKQAKRSTNTPREA